ncbi:Apoptosis inhibitor 5 [Mortierella sp. AM989]|nr:Apoptosis inhibitor 5 [Mortierella sp. AM989]
MADLDAIYNAYNEITDAKDKAPEHLDAYTTIIAASQGSEGAKRLAAQFIPVFFKHFPALHMKAIDGVFDLCEDESSLIRQAAIKSLPSLCKDGQHHTTKIADVLCQLLELVDDQDLPVVQAALQTLMIQSPREVLAVIFRQGVKEPDLRERALDFITHQVMASKETLFKDPEIELFFLEEMQKTMGSVSDSELEIFAKIIMQTKSYQSGKVDLTGLLNVYIQHITSEKPFDTNDQELVKRLIVAGRLSMPLFKRTISADPLLEFFASNILPRSAFNKLADKQKTPVLRLYADSLIIGHPSQPILNSAGELLADLLLIVVPADQESAVSIQFAQVECLTSVLYFIAAKIPEIIEKEELAVRFRNLYMTTQAQISSLKLSLTTAQSKKPQNAEDISAINNLSKAIQIHTNIYSVVKEFLKPKHLRSTKVIIHPSWKPVPESVIPNTTNAPKASKPPIPSSSKPSLSTSKSTTKASNKPVQKPAPTQQQQQQQQQRQHQTVNIKRKSELEPNPKPKKPKIVRRHVPAGGNSPGSSSPGHGSKTSQQQAQPAQHPPSPSQHGKKASGSFNGPGRRHSNPSSFDSRRGRDSNGRISFLKR